MVDYRAEFAASRSNAGETVVLDGKNHTVCRIPAKVSVCTYETRDLASRWDIATLIARLLNEEAKRCREAGTIPPNLQRVERIAEQEPIG